MRKIAAFILSVAVLWTTAANADGFFPGKPPDMMLLPRHALVIGVSEYKHLPTIKNPKNDAEKFADKLSALGFDTVTLTQPKYPLLDKTTIFTAFHDVAESVEKDHGVFLFYFAGHGLSHKQETYLAPQEANLSSLNVQDSEEEKDRRLEDDLQTWFIPMQEVFIKMSNAKPAIAIIITDACRDDPLGNIGSPAIREKISIFAVGPGTEQPHESIIFYSTIEGKRSSDGLGKNSPFTALLLKYIDEPDTDIKDVFQDVVRTFPDDQGEQEPQIYPRLKTLFRFMMEQKDFYDEKRKYEEAKAEAKAKGSSSYETFLDRTRAGYFAARVATEKGRVQEMEKAIEDFKLGAHTAQDRRSQTFSFTAKVQSKGVESRLVTAAENARLRVTPDESSASITLVPGEHLTKIGEVGNYLNVLRDDGTRGFVLKISTFPVDNEQARVVPLAKHSVARLFSPNTRNSDAEHRFG